MNIQDRQAFVETVLGFAELKGKQLSAPAIELYWRAMQEWAIDDFKTAAEQLLRTCTFMPTPKDFEDLVRAGEDTVGEAWERAVASAGSCYRTGNYGPGGTCGDDQVDHVVRMIGGYRAIAMCDPDKLHFLERRFAAHYETQQDRDRTRNAVPSLAYRASRLQLNGPTRVGLLLGHVVDDLDSDE